jgi:hypothetical protein
MGFSDRVRIDRAYPDLGIERGRDFQTKSLNAGGDDFTISADGKLVEHVWRHEFDAGRFSSTRIAGEDKLIAYHGDVLLFSRDPYGNTREFVARFTHGQLEWIRPVSEYPIENLHLLVEQGAR